MVIKDTEEAKGKLNIGNLEINKETVQDLTDADAEGVVGGIGGVGRTDGGSLCYSLTTGAEAAPRTCGRTCVGGGEA